MPITAIEKFQSRTGDNSSIELLYTISGTDDDVEARAALASTAPGTYSGLVRDDDSLHVEPLGAGMWDGRVRYNKSTFQAPTTGDASFSFDTTGGTQHITQAKQTINRYAPAGKTAPDFAGAIGVTNDSVEGVDITVPVFNFSVTRYLTPAEVIAAYVSGLYALTGKVNNGTFSISVDGVVLSLAAGECLFVGAGGSKRRSENDWEINFRFAGSPNVSGITIGTITGISKKGWEYLWVRYDDAEDATAKTIVKKPIAVYVEKVYEDGDFSVLGIT